MRPAHGNYRADIDGLRAVSVVAVILFHADYGVPGGFVGVDVFFVISGYLITRLIAADLESGVFSLARFWDRRIRRIWPASLAMTMVVLAAAYALMLPKDLRSVASDAVANVAMLANIRYWHITNYFVVAADLRPLVHTWSLAVEEQFYVLFPLVMMLAWKWGRNWCLGVLTLLATASFVASAFVIDVKPMDVFFLLPYRAWELLVGGMIALAAPQDQQHTTAQPSSGIRWTAEAAGAIGLVMIGVPCFMYDRQTPFPAVAALPPCMGAALLILAGTVSKGSLPNRVLASAPFRGLGLLSYSLYLWHWPVLAFMRYHAGVPLPTALTLATLPLIVASAYVSWRFVETPFRRTGVASSPFRTMIAGGMAAGVVLACGLGIRTAGGVPSRFTPAELRLLEPFSTDWDHNKKAKSNEFVSPPSIGLSEMRGRPCLLLWGDSHGMAISPAVDDAARDLGLTGIAALKSSAFPLPGAWQPGSRFFNVCGKRESQEWSESVIRWIRDFRPRHILLCARWSMYLVGNVPDRGDLNLIAQLDADTVNRNATIATMESGLRRVMAICEETDTDVWVLLEPPCQPTMPRQITLARHWYGPGTAIQGVSRSAHERIQRPMHAAFVAQAGGRLHVVDLADPFFDADGVSRVGREDVSWYSDESHLSVSGAREMIGPLMRQLFTEMATDCNPR